MRLRVDITRLDRWQELVDVILRNKLRTALTGLAVAWGIFMLIILLGAGQGLQNSVEHNFRDDARNSIFVRRGETSIPYKGHPVGREINFENEDYDEIGREIDEIDHLTGRYFAWRNSTVKRGDKYAAYRITAVHPDHKYLEKTIITEGRFVNEIDVAERRKVAVISQPIREFLFGAEEPLGDYIEIGGIAYRVVGVFEDAGGEGELRRIYIPVSTAQAAYGGANRLHMILFTVGDSSADESRGIADRARHLLAENHVFSPEDKRAVRAMNNLERFEEVQQIFTWIRVFIWMLGFGTILAGIVGVSNIMLIAVSERTKEFGVRKAIGATPWSIVSMVLQEAIVLTAVAGYLGVLAGIGVLELGAALIPENEYLRNPSVDLGVVLMATAVLVVSGALAGYFPARRAAKVKPVVALRDE